MADPLSSGSSKKSSQAKKPAQQANGAPAQDSGGGVHAGAGRVLVLDPRAMDWDGVEVPNRKLREQMEQVDKMLQPIRRRDDGTMHLPSAEELGRPIGVGEKKMREVIQTMRDLYNIPVHYNARRFGYEYTEDVVFSPWVQLSESEMVAIYLTQQLGVFQGTTFRKRLQSAFRKVAGVFGKALSFDRRLLDECFSFDQCGPHAVFHPDHLDTCCRAMLRQEELVLNYTKASGEGAGIPELRRVRPLHVTYRDFAWYVLCHDLLRKEPRLFMVTRINSIEETRVKFARPTDFDARAFLDKAFKVFVSGEAEEMALDFAPGAARRVRERRWHASQSFRVLANGWTRMRIKVPVSPDLLSWIGGFYEDCVVVGSETLRDEVAARTRRAAERYERASPAASNVQLPTSNIQV